MNCPVCNASLSDKYFDRIEVMHCQSCGGFWIQKNRLGKVLDRYMRFLAERRDRECERHKRVNPWKVETVRVLCPECGRAMTKLNYAYNSNVIVDQCETCGGVWLDKGEIEKIAEFLKYCGIPESFKKKSEEIRAIYDRAERGAAAGSLLGFILGLALTAFLDD